MKIIILLLSLFTLSTGKLISEGKGNSIYLNPGIKLGYQFGEGGGFVYGLEVSVTTYTKSSFPLPGVVFNIDRCKGKTKFIWEHNIFMVRNITWSYSLFRK